MLYALGQIDSFRGTGVWSFIKVDRSSEKNKDDKDQKDSSSKKINQTNRFGLRGMRDRIQNLGGKFVIESLSGKGTKISSIVPSAKIKDVE